jgi:hypothetical protein
LVSRSTSLTIESISDPIWPRCIAPGRSDGNYIKAAGALRPAVLFLQEELRRLDQLLLFASVDTLECATPCGVAPVANLDEYYCIAIEHDQIKLAATACPISTQQAQSVLLKMLECEIFRELATDLLARGDQ